MTYARIPVEIGLKGHFGSMLAAMGSSTSPARLERTYARAHFLRLEYTQDTVHGSNPCPP